MSRARPKVIVPICPACGRRERQPHRSTCVFYRRVGKPQKLSNAPGNKRLGYPWKLRRMWKHVLKSALASGKPRAVAERIAAAVVNKYRAKRARSGRGPKLVSRGGGSRRQWWPGKKRRRDKRGRFV